MITQKMGIYKKYFYREIEACSVFNYRMKGSQDPKTAAEIANVILR